jgi:REP element-mobilizing transposase RayT
MRKKISGGRTPKAENQVDKTLRYAKNIIMSRPLRIEYEHAFYHVVSRGHRREIIFRNDGDRKIFLDKLSLAAERLQLKIHAYVLMSNHYHLLIETPKANIAQAMHDINAGYANWYRNKYRLAGSIFQGRYKAVIVEKDEYLLILSAYIHLNPVKAGMVKKPEGYAWSSYRSYIGTSKPVSFLFKSEILSKFRKKSAYGQYVLGFLEDGNEITQRDVYGRNSFLGNDGFIRRALSGFKGRKRNSGEVIDEKELQQVSVDNVLEIMMATFHVGDDGIRSRRKGNVYRKMFIHLLRKYTDLSLLKIGKMLDMKYRAVSELERYFLSELAENSMMRRMVARAEKDLRKMAFWR